MNLPQPSLDSWTTFFLLAAGQGFFIALMLYSTKKGNRRANALLGTFILLFAITLVDYVGYWTHYNQFFPWFASIHQNLVFLFGPLLWLYFKTIEANQPFRKKDFLHFLPAILFSCGKLIHWWTWFPAGHTYFNLLIFLMLSHLAAYGLVMWRFLKNKKKNANGHLSSQGFQIKLKWFRTLLWLYSGFVLGYLAYYLLSRTPFFTLTQDYSISLAMTVFIYAVGYLGYKQPEIFSGLILKNAFLSGKYQNSSLTPAASQSLLVKLLEYMDKDKPFLDNELRLTTLADELKVSVHHLSQVVNEQVGKSFSDFINDYRVEAAKKMLLNPKNKDIYIINVAYAAGFNNKTSFNKAFKNYTGLSPSEFRKQQLQVLN